MCRVSRVLEWFCNGFGIVVYWHFGGFLTVFQRFYRGIVTLVSVFCGIVLLLKLCDDFSKHVYSSFSGSFFLNNINMFRGSLIDGFNRGVV